MPDAAVENAIAVMQDMAEKIAKAKLQIEEWQQKSMRAERFVADWEEFSGQKAPAIEPPVSNAVQTDTSKRPKPKNPKKEDVAEAAREIILTLGVPQSRDDIFAILPEKGMVIEGKDPPVVLQTMLWRMKDRIVHLKGHGYWPADEPYAPAEYDPAKAVEEDLALDPVTIPTVPPIEEFIKAHEGKELKGTVTYGRPSPAQRRTDADYDPDELA